MKQVGAMARNSIRDLTSCGNGYWTISYAQRDIVRLPVQSSRPSQGLDKEQKPLADLGTDMEMREKSS